MAWKLHMLSDYAMLCKERLDNAGINTSNGWSFINHGRNFFAKITKSGWLHVDHENGLPAVSFPVEDMT